MIMAWTDAYCILCWSIFKDHFVLFCYTGMMLFWIEWPIAVLISYPEQHHSGIIWNKQSEDENGVVPSPTSLL